MGGNNEFFKKIERKKYLKKLPSMQRVKLREELDRQDYCRPPTCSLDQSTNLQADWGLIINFWGY